MTIQLLRFDDALRLARAGNAIARQGKDHFYRLFDDGLYIGIFAMPDADLKPAKWIRCPSIVADDWYIVEKSHEEN